MTSLGHKKTWSWRPGWQRPAGTHRRAGVVPSAEVEAALLIHRVVDAGQLWGLRPGGRKGVIEEAVVGAASGDKEVSRLRLGRPRCNDHGRPAGIHPTAPVLSFREGSALSPLSNRTSHLPGAVSGHSRAAVRISAWSYLMGPLLTVLEGHAEAKMEGQCMDYRRAHCTEGRRKVSLPCGTQDAGP